MSSRGRGRGKPIGQNYRSKFTSRTSIKSMRVSGGDDAEDKQSEAQAALQRAIDNKARVDGLDSAYGFDSHDSGERVGWLFNVCSTSSIDEELKLERSAVELYFLESDGSSFKATYVYKPYFFIAVSKDSLLQEVEAYLLRRFDGQLDSTCIVAKEDLELNNHLSGLKRNYIKLMFKNVQDLMSVRKVIQAKVFSNKSTLGATAVESYKTAVEDTSGLGLGVVHGLGGILGGADGAERKPKNTDYLDHIVDMREYDVPYIVRAMIDMNFRIGLWYVIKASQGDVTIEQRKDLIAFPEPRVLAFDIETTKLPLKFPDAQIDSIMMISYMLDGQGYLIVNRQIVSEDIADFHYTPKPEFQGPFHCINEPNEKALLERWFSHIRETRPNVYVSYNGDRFDWPFIEARCAIHGLNMMDEIGIWKDQEEYRGRFAVHIDCFHWVQRDSYLPQGSQGLKAVTKAKLKYNPLELDPEDMLPFAQEKPQVLASYSVSDAVATYYLYMTYVHLFIFSLCTIIPLPPADVLRKGSGTLCEQLLMVEAYRGNIICPNKQKDLPIQFYKSHLLESETYIGGHVESLEPGVFRADIPCKFKIIPAGAQYLIDNVDKILHFALTVEGGVSMDVVTNYDDVRKEIVDQLASLRDQPNIEVNPLIYHLDVAAMYPNIILTNRLQPMAVTNPAQCAACDFNNPANNCKRPLTWVWRGEYFPANRSEFEAIKAQIEADPLPPAEAEPWKFAQPAGGKFFGGSQYPRNDGSGWQRAPRTFLDLPEEEQAIKIKARVKEYSRRVYKRTHDKKEEEREAVTCQRENPFYVDTVRAFRDRRYEYKTLTKIWKGKEKEATNAVETVQAKNMVLLYDSLQLAHKCILNSFYGYVMRRGARWHSMEMAGVVTKTGSEIIKDATLLVKQLGRPLELDTDGIWCILPCTFPENFTIKTSDPKKPKVNVAFPCSMLNVSVHEKYNNPQYQTLKEDGSRQYTVSQECSIFFEIDGPYKAMCIPASTEEGRNLKKRYAVFNFDGSLAELKGFEIKRRGELKLIKTFQAKVFDAFLKGTTLKECYDEVAMVADRDLDVLFSQGADLEDEQVFDLISEARSMSASLEEYGDQKGTAITTARRLAQFLGDSMVKDKGLSCKFIVSKAPAGDPVSARAVPVAIFSAEPHVMRKYLRLWLKDQSLNDFDVRSILDWDYYITRLGACIQKIISIPAALQNVSNPVPRVPYPDWLIKRVREMNSSHKQTSISAYFSSAPKDGGGNVMDIEDFDGTGAFASQHRSMATVRRRIREHSDQSADNGPVDLTREQQEKPSTAIVRAPPAPVVAAPIVPPPPFVAMEQDMVQWIKFAKHSWKELRAKNKRRRELRLASGDDQNDDNEVSSGKPNLRDGLSGYMRQAAANVQERVWHIVSVSEDEGSGPGVFRVWAFLDASQLQCITVNVPRIFYMNLRHPDDKRGGKLIAHRTLPRGRECLNLYEFTHSEAEWQDESKDLANFLHDPNVEGVYETRVSLLFRFLISVGCVARVDRQKYKQESREAAKVLQTKRATESNKSIFASTAAAAAAANPPPIPLSLRHLQMYNSADTPAYLSNAVFRRVYFYHSVAIDGRAMFGLMIESVQHDEAKGLVIVVNPFSGDLTERVNYTALLPKVVAEFNQQQSPEFGAPPLQVPPQTVFDPTQFPGVPASLLLAAKGGSAAATATSKQYVEVKNEAEAVVVLRAVLQEFRLSYRGPCLFLAQCPEEASALHRMLPILRTDFPLITVPAHLTDNSYRALSWLPQVSKTFLQRYAESGVWFAEQLAFCRYAHVPIGNISRDPHALVADVMFARRLTNENHLLWASDTTRPDLGGLEEDENFFADEHTNPEVSFPGCIRSFCVELNLYSLAVNSLLKMATLEDMEGQDLDVVEAVTKDSASAEPISHADNSQLLVAPSARLLADDKNATRAALKILCSAVATWFADVVQNRNPFADALLSHLYRWLRSSVSCLYDPALHRLVHRLMKKVFVQLLAELKRLGARVIYASFSKLIIVTGKHSVSHALTYVQYARNTIMTRDLFQYLALEPARYFEQLVFMDAANYSAVLPIMPGQPLNERPAPKVKHEKQAPREKVRRDHEDDEMNSQDEDEYEDEEADDYGSDNSDAEVDPDNIETEQDVPQTETSGYAYERVLANWNVATYLPDLARRAFLRMAAEFIWLPYRYITEHQQQVSLTQAHNTQTDSASVDEFLQSLVEGPFSHRLFSMVQSIIRVHPPDARAGDDSSAAGFPFLPGSHLSLTNPALEFIKYTTHLMSLDPTIQSQIRLVKANLLKLVDVRPFAVEAEYRNPCATFVLPDVICSFCNECHDLDICRDPRLVASLDWRCEECRQPYDRSSIEFALVTVVQRRSVAYQIQDLVCQRCRLVKVENMAEFCKCSGSFRTRESAESFAQSLRIFRNIAKIYQFPWLEETVKFVLQ